MSGPQRIPGGPTATICFTFDGVPMRARPGDTLAAALLANGVGLVGRSFKFHRPRGVMTAAVEEPNALVTIGTGGRTEPNTRATDVFVYDGLVARSQNRWPSLAFDAGAILGLAAPVFAAGFYYKTFFGPPKRWMIYERFIRRAAGLGPAPTTADPDAYEHRAAFADLLVVGSGPAGLAAATAAAAAGERVLLVEQDAYLGGTLRADGSDLAPIETTRAAILAAGGRIQTRTTASGLWDHGFVTLSQRVAEPGQPGPLAQRYWQVRAERIVLATGAIERPMTFAGNDRPGVMLARAVRTYIRRFGVLPGKRVVLATNNDDAYKTADAVTAAGGEVVAILDSRAAFSAIARAANGRYPVYLKAMPRRAVGSGGCLTAVEADSASGRRAFAADCLAVSGGFTPVVHLHSQGGGRLDWRDDIQAFVPGATLQNMTTFGSAAGEVEKIVPAPAMLDYPKSSFIDFQNDVTAADVDLAWAEGYRSVEHLKRYTTLGMGTDQGKTSNMAALGRLAGAGATTIPAAGLTTFRAPYTPLTLGALAGPDGGGYAAPSRRLALADAHDALNPIWQPLGLWHRPRAYPRARETLHDAALREARAVRTAAGIIDVSTLAKFIVTGPDAAALLEIVCATGVAKLAVGRGRYTFMLREDGMVMDDGTVWRLDETRYLLTSSTGGAERMEAHLGYAQHVLASHLRASVVAVQEAFAGIALAGPNAAVLLESLSGTVPPSHMGVADAVVAGVPVLILAASYSGERAFELYPAGDAAAPVWGALYAAGAVPYGIDALEFLRIEKGHVVVGGEADGRTTPHDLRLERMLRKSGGFVGASALDRPALAAPDRLQLVGLTSPSPIPEGAMLVATTGSAVEGHVTAGGLRVLGEGGVALALLRGGRGRNGQTLLATSPTRRRMARVTVTDPIFYDTEGTCYRG